MATSKGPARPDTSQTLKGPGPAAPAAPTSWGSVEVPRRQGGPAPKPVLALVSAAVFAVFAVCSVVFSHSVITSAVLVSAGVLMSAGSWLLLVSVNLPDELAAIDLNALVGADSTLKEAASALNGMLARMDKACGSDDPRGIAGRSRELRAVVDSMADLVKTEEFASSKSDEDHRMVLSLATSWLPDAWDSLVDNVRYLGFGGKASARAQENLAKLDAQCASVAGALDRIRSNIVENASSQIETGADYLRQRLGSDTPDELKL